MTVLRARATDAQGNPVSGRTATLEPYGANRYQGSPSYGIRSRGLAATSGSDGWMQWTIPDPQRRPGPKGFYWVIRGLEDDPVITATRPDETTVTLDSTAPRVGTLDQENDLIRTPVVDTAGAEFLPGVVGDGVADDTAALQAAIDALGPDGGVVSLPPGHYRTIAPLVVHSGVTFVGAGEQSSFIELATAGVHCIAGTDLSHVSVRDLHLTGTGQTGTAADGIHFDLSGTAGNATFYASIENVYVEQFSRDGVSVQTPIVSTFTRVMSFHVGRHGLNLYSSGEADGTSCAITACYTAGAWGAGYHLKQMAYSTLDGCAADACGIAYEYDTCVGITESGCGSEEPYDFSTHSSGYTGLSRKVFNSKAAFNSPYMIGNIGTAFWVTNGSRISISELFEGSPGNPDAPVSNPTVSLLVDSGCKVILTNPSTMTATNLAAGTTTILPDAIGSGGGGGAASDGNALPVEATLRRADVSSSALALGASGSLRLTYFPATASRTLSSLRMVTGGTAAGATPTLCRMGIYSVAVNGNLTLLAATANDPTLFAAANTAYARATTAPFAVVAGQRYAIGVLVITAAALPTFLGNALPGTYGATLLGLDPRITAAYSGQTDLPATVTWDVLATMATVFYAEAF